MRTTLKLAALGVAVVTVALWFFGGPNWGWTKTSVAVPFVDPVTNLEGAVWENRFLPGVDFLATGLVVAGLLLAGSFFARKG